MSRILFVSGSLGLGHVTRDVAIAAAIRQRRPDVHIDWFAGSPAKEYLRDHGEQVLPEADRFSDLTDTAERAAGPGRLDLNRWAMSIRSAWAKTGRFCADLLRTGRYDLLIGDEAYDVAAEVTGFEQPIGPPVFILYDFLGLDRTRVSLLDWLIVLKTNSLWRTEPRGRYLPIFLGELDDVPLRPFVPFGESRRAWAERNMIVVGHVLDFDPADYKDRLAVRKRLGYGPQTTIVVSVGGTSIGGALIERCLEAFALARHSIPDLQMKVVCGPRLALSFAAPEGVEIMGYVPRLYEHFAAADLSIVQAGGSSTLELAALNRPFLYFPLERHCEQLKHVAPRLRRLGAGVELRFRTTSASDLARHIKEQVGREVTYKSVSLDGARRIAQLVAEHLGS